MNVEHVNLTEDGRVYFDVYLQVTAWELPNSQKRPLVLVCPGGGYQMTSEREADPIAMAFMAEGFHTAVLRYSVGQYAQFPNSLTDLSKTMKYIRAHAAQWHVDPERIAVCGFSAGGHLAASLGVYWNDPEIAEQAGCLQGENKPNALILGYPVITGRRYTHQGSIQTLMQYAPEGTDLTAFRDRLSLELHVGAQTPPTFLFHTYTDNTVAVENALLFAAALSEHYIPFELHIFEKGDHGLALANHVTYYVTGNLNPDAAKWMNLCTNWLWNLFGRDIPNPPYPQPVRKIIE